MDKNTWNETVTNGAYAAELDWFAVDNNGQIAVFAATSNAPIPEKVNDLIAKPDQPIHLSDLPLLANNLMKLDCEFDNGDLSIDKVK